MGISDKKFLSSNQTARNRLIVPVITAISLTSAVIFSFTPGYTFQLVAAVSSFTRTKAGVVTAVVKVGTRTAATIVFTAATEVQNALSATLANIQGSKTEAITVELTTDGSGVLANADLVISVRPRPLNGEAQ